MATMKSSAGNYLWLVDATDPQDVIGVGGAREYVELYFETYPLEYHPEYQAWFARQRDTNSDTTFDQFIQETEAVSRGQWLSDEIEAAAADIEQWLKERMEVA